MPRLAAKFIAANLGRYENAPTIDSCVTQPTVAWQAAVAENYLRKKLKYIWGNSQSQTGRNAAKVHPGEHLPH